MREKAKFRLKNLKPKYEPVECFALMIHCTYLLFKLASLVNSHLDADVLAKALFGSLIAKMATFGLGCSSNQPCLDKDY